MIAFCRIIEIVSIVVGAWELNPYSSFDFSFPQFPNYVWKKILGNRSIFICSEWVKKPIRTVRENQKEADNFMVVSIESWKKKVSSYSHQQVRSKNKHRKQAQILRVFVSLFFGLHKIILRNNAQVFLDSLESGKFPYRNCSVSALRDMFIM